MTVPSCCRCISSNITGATQNSTSFEYANRELFSVNSFKSKSKSKIIEESNNTWTFHLRENVQFHDGTPFNADAVVFSLMRQKDPAHPYAVANAAFCKSSFSQVEENKKIEDMLGVAQVKLAKAEDRIQELECDLESASCWERKHDMYKMAMELVARMREQESAGPSDDET